MYVKSITLEGFKSYGNRTVISGFDPSFNAITGLNGSGKSNILDSICFVLGISNLSQVRATSLNELVYKNGQAGINKATVTITFDNSEKSTSPLGYESHKDISVTRIVVTGGKNKYLINNVGANNNRVHDLFQSVQLNVNNPHFLIMQGRITKVLNMKPLEILSMIEEAAGTRMYKDKKELSLKQLEKKESKLREINTMLDDHICPELERLKKERKEYTEYTRVTREYEKLSKLCVAWEYTRTEEMIEESTEEKEKLQEQSNKLKASIAEMKQKIENIDKQVNEIEKQMDEEGGNKLKVLEEELKKIQVSEAKADACCRNLLEAINEAKKEKAELEKNLREEKSTLVQKEKDLKNSLVKLADLKSISEKDEAAVVAAENHFHAVNAGLSDADGEEASLAAQLITAGKEKIDAETEQKSIEMSLKHLKTQLDKMQSELKNEDKSYNQDQASYHNLEKEIQKLKAEISKLGYEDGKFETMLAQEKKLASDIEHLKDRIDSVYARYPQLSFDYVDPVKNFDRRKVHGLACLQIEIIDPKYTVPLDLTAGGRLYNIILDNEETGKLLLNRGQLKRRCTFIPLNKIIGYPISNKVVEAAQALVGKENVIPALKCVRYDNALTPAMEYIFGNTFICSDIEAAKQVAFAKNIMKKCVTLDGEVVDPSGTLSGGALGNKGKLLAEIAPVANLNKSVYERQHQLDKLRNEIKNVGKIKERYDALHEQCELKENAAHLLKTRIEQSTYHKQLEEVKKLQLSLETQKEQLTACNEKKIKLGKLLKELEAKSSKSNRETKIKEVEKRVADLKRKASASLQNYNALDSEVSTLKIEIEAIHEGIPACEEAVENSENSIKEYENKLQEAEENRKVVKQTVASKTEELKSQKTIMKSHSIEISKISKEKEVMAKNISNSELQIQQLEHDIKNCSNTVADANRRLKYLLDSNKWISAQKKFFGAANSEFDFQALDPKAASSRLKELEKLKDDLHKNVNMRAQNMLANCEDQFKSLMKRKDIVLKDKSIIEEVISELDEQTKEALKQACNQVNKDFGSIFRTLLPGTDAKLIPQPGKTVLDGLEFKVAFGEVWKESLNELSGGQRSLVALSLILALLLFNPAPIYILDEVDAALDLSHTQNIGKMLKMHFKKSQFIIVSLKEGMFDNANVLFKTRFVDGMSSVTRISQKK